MSAEQTGQQIVDDLLYRSYRWNRMRSPEVEVWKYRALYYSDVERFEARYQAELAQKFEDLIRAAAASLQVTTVGQLSEAELKRNERAREQHYDISANT